MKESILFKSVFNATPIILWVLSLDGLFIDSNESFKKISGYADDELKNMSMRDIIDPDHYEEVKKSFTSLIRGDVNSIRATRRFICKHGDVVWADVSASPIRGENGQVTAVACTVFDMTRRINMEVALRNRNGSLDTLFEKKGDAVVVLDEEIRIIRVNRIFEEISTDVVFITDLDLAVIYVSPSVKRITGYSQEEFKLLKLQEFFSGDSYGRAKEMLKEGLLGGYNAQLPLTTEYKCLHKDGSSRWIETVTKLILSEYGHPVGITGGSRDITERKRAEEALRRSEIKYRMLTEKIKDVVFGLTPDLLIDYISPVVSEFSGYTPEEMTGTHISSYLEDSEELDTAVVLLEQAFSGNATVTTYEFRFRAKDRPDFYVEVFCNAVYEGRQVLLLQCVARDITQKKRAEDALREREQHLSVENIYLKRSIQKSERFGNIIGKSEAMQRVYELIIKAASSPANVVISGESGTGKELAARAIHDMSPRANKPFVPVNCGAIPDAIIESEFFGYKKGAFTGAACDKAGFLDLAEGGTLFLDEVGEIGLSMQVKLLRALDGGGYTPIGCNQVKHVVFSIVAATNKDLTELVRQRKMREDFFFRIHVIPIRLPPLRHRPADIPLLIDHFFMKAGTDKPLPRISSKIRRALMGYSWPGNVRELQNVLNRFLVLNKVDFIGLPGGGSPVESGRSKGDIASIGYSGTLASQVERFEEEIIQSHLKRYQWNRSRVAQVLKIDRKTLASKIKKFKIVPMDEE